MKKLKSTLVACGALALLASCSNNDGYDGFDYSDKTTAVFTTNIHGLSNSATRATDTQWESGDAIGIYAIKANSALEDGSIHAGKANIKHTTLTAASSAKFTAAVPTEAIQLDGKTAIDVIGYYPYTTPVTNYSLPINVKNQSNQAAIDILYSNSLKNLKSVSDAKMAFKHSLSKIVFSVEPTTSYPNLTGLGAKDLAGLKVEGTFDLKTGTSTLSGNVATIQPKVNGTTVTAILVPGQKLDKSVSVKFTLGTEVFTWTPSKDYDLTSGYKYTFRIQLSKDGSVVTLNPEGTIEDWTEGADGGVDTVTPGGKDDPDPKPEPGDITTIAEFNAKFAAATQEAPITIAEDITVKGIIVANDVAKNIDKKIFVADKTGTIGFYIFPASGLLADDYKVGQEIEIKTKGLAMTAYGDAKQVAFPNETGKNKTKAIELADFKNLSKITNTSIAPVTPKVYTLDQVNSTLINQLIEIKDVTFVDAGQPYTVDGKHTNRMITDGSTNVAVRTRSTADFATELIPSGKVNVVVIVDSFKGELQLILRTKEDVKASGVNPDPVDNLSVDKTALSFGEAASAQAIAVTSNVAWTATADATWFTIAPASGNGNGTINVNATANTGAARSGKITLNGGSKSAVVTINQAAGDKVNPGEETIVFLETFGANTGAKLDVKFGDFDGYANFAAKANGITVSNAGSRADIRARQNVMNFEVLAWLPAYNPAFPISPESPAPTVKFSNVNTVGMTGIKVYFDMSANFSKQTANTNYVNIFVDGKKVNVPSKELTEAEYGNAYYTVEVAIDAPFSTIEFKTDERNNTGIRLDNIKVVGKK